MKQEGVRQMGHMHLKELGVWVEDAASRFADGSFEA